MPFLALRSTGSAMSDVNHTFRLPVPDPTILTTEQLRRELLGLRELLESRLDGTERAVKLEIAYMREAREEKYVSIQMQFRERDSRRDQEMISAKEAITKSEAAVAKQLENNAQNLASLSKITDDKMSIINRRLDRGEGGSEQQREIRSDTHMTIGTVVSLIIGVVGVLSFILAIATFAIQSRSSYVAPTVVAPAVVPVQPIK